MKYKYVLGDSQRERARLKAQAKLWDPISFRFFDRLKIRPRSSILEIGPGQGSLHLELRKRARGPVDFVERSPVFANRLQRLSSRDGLGEGRMWVEDLEKANLPKNHYDLIFARWVFLFLPNPLKHLEILKASLKKGGILAIQDYHRTTMQVIPDLPYFQEFVEADVRLFGKYGGDVNIGRKLPSLLARTGFQTREIIPHILSGEPGSQVWNWVHRYYVDCVVPKASEMEFSEKKAFALKAVWDKASKSILKSYTTIGPTVLDITAIKKTK